MIPAHLPVLHQHQLHLCMALSASIPYSTTFLDFLPSVDTTKPTPHASYSWFFMINIIFFNKFWFFFLNFHATILLSLVLDFKY